MSKGVVAMLALLVGLLGWATWDGLGGARAVAVGDRMPDAAEYRCPGFHCPTRTEAGTIVRVGEEGVAVAADKDQTLRYYSWGEVALIYGPRGDAPAEPVADRLALVDADSATSR